ncbi:unnamed protein product [Ceutorhynchus assimilis]|uniref:Thioredoxin domain-containing protein 17 n=1 Tax=Ceutorhynchus assimilis TaxID=467358 RepID=A0A9N9MA33_9CUCU|nr:unnamed protein product [Ceutorhynchus assimilis]
MVVVHYLQGYDQYVKFFQEFNSHEQKAYVYFTGNKDSSGQSWCPDCNNAWPVVMGVLDALPDNHPLVIVEVGEREEWKNPQNPFRKDKVRLRVIPTIAIWNEVNKLEGVMCEKQELVSMLLEEFED